MNSLEIKNLGKSYKDFSLSGVDLTLPEGCIMGLIGENGAGKSTVIKLILNMIRRDTGTVRLFGQDNLCRLDSLKEDIGVVLDEVGLPECLNAKQVNGVMRNIFHNWSDDAYREYLRRLSVPDGKSFGELSRGMKMKLGIAVALSHSPRLLILDEATNGLDPVARDEVTDIFSEFTRDEKHAVLISSHIVSDLEKISDYIAFLHNGRLLLCEEKDKLLESYTVVHCTAEELSGIDPAAVIGQKASAYGVEAVVRRDAAPSGLKQSPVSIEELFINMVKEER